jgi:hypothetical protein
VKQSKLAWFVVLAACAHSLALLFVQVRHPFPFLNDSVLHFGLIQSLASAGARGQSLLDPWVPSWNLGFPVYHYYQNLPHLAVVGLAKISLGSISLLQAFKIVEWLAVCTLPIPVFLAVRRFGFSPLRAACAGAFSLWIRTNYLHGLDFESYTWQGLGQFTQAVGGWFLPLAIAWSFTAIRTGLFLGSAALFMTATILCHLALGTMALMAAGILAVVSMHDLPRRLLRFSILAVVSIAASAYSLVPIFQDFAYYNVSSLVPSWKYDSFGHGVILSWLARGELFDFDRLPILTILLAAGFILSSARARSDEGSRAILILFLFFLFLFFGRPTWGAMLRFFPLGDGFHYSRAIFLVHLLGAMMAGIFMGAAVEWIAGRSQHRRAAASAAFLASLVCAFPLLRERTEYLLSNASLVRESASSYQKEKTDLESAVLAARADRSGRVYAGFGPAGGSAWGGAFMVGWVPVYDWLPIREVDAVGYLHHMWSLNADLFQSFDERNPTHFRVFGVNRILAPASGVRVLPSARPVAVHGRFQVLEIPSNGFVELVDAPFAVNVHKKDLTRTQQLWLKSPLPATGVFPRVRMLEVDAPDPSGVTVSSYDVRFPLPSVESPRGELQSVERKGEDFLVQARTDRPCFLLLKMSYHPRWKATVNGKAVTAVHLLPSYIGVPLDPGTQRVELRFEPGPLKEILAFSGGVLLLSFLIISRRWMV